MTEKLSIERKDEGEQSLLSLSGTIDEDADFSKVFAELKPNVIINLGGINMINSCGVREWIQAIRKIPESAEVHYHDCPPRIVEQINYIENFLGSGKIDSFFAPYFCPKCKMEVNVPISVEEVKSKKPYEAPDRTCPKCKGPLEFDDVEEEYFSFLDTL